MCIYKFMLKFIWEGTGPRIDKIILTKENKMLGTSLPYVKTYYIATINKTVWFWQRNRDIHQWNVIENPQIEPQKYAQLIFENDESIICYIMFIDLASYYDFNFYEDTDYIFSLFLQYLVLILVHNMC